MPSQEWISLALYLGLISFIGFFCSRKSCTFKNYALGGGQLKGFTLFAAIASAIIGANTTLGLSSQGYAIGVVFILTYIGCILQQWIVTFVFAKKIKECFPNAICLGDIINNLYGRQAQFVVGIFSVIFSIGIMSAQVAGIGYLLSFILDISYDVGCIVSCGVVILYSVFLGIRGIQGVHFFQLVMGFLILAISVSIGIQQNGGLLSTFASIPSTQWELFRVISPGVFLCLLLVRMLGTFLSPAYLQRILAAKSAKEYIYTSNWATLFFTLMFAFSFGTGLIALTLYPNIEPNLAMPFLLKDIFPSFLTGFAIASVLAIIISTMDAWLHVASIAFVHDIIWFFQNNQASDQKLKLTSVSSVVLTFTSLGFCLTVKDIPYIILNAFSFWVPTILGPLALGILGYKLSLKGFYTCMGIGLSTLFIWSVWLEKSLTVGTLLGLLINIICFAILYYDQNRKMKREEKRVSENLKSLYVLTPQELDPIHN